MDLPPSGWYPDPYGVPDLLRWWDGSAWTQHTHAGVGGAGGAEAGGGGAAGGSGAGSGSGGGGWATRDRVIGDWAGTDWPSGDQLANTLPPKGPRTEPQPALPATSVQSAVQATTYQQPVQATTYQQPVQATAYQPTVQPGGGDGSGTQVLFLDAAAWQVPGGPGGPGAPGGPNGPNRYGYQQAQRRRRMWLIGGLIAGTAVAIGIIVVVATSLGSSPTPNAADQAATTPTASPTAAAATPTAATPTPTAPASASVTATAPASVLSDGQSGLSYTQLATPWTPVCPSALASAFSWTAGESAVAGQINGGQAAWYGKACSGPLPAQYNYSGVADLENTATNVAQTLENAYYSPLSHTASPELSQPITVSGHPGWEIEYLMSYTNAAAQGATFTTEEGAVVVADTGTGNTPVVFFTSVPENLNEANVASLVSSLQLTVVPAAGTASPTASVTPPASTTPTPGGSPTATSTGTNP